MVCSACLPINHRATSPKVFPLKIGWTLPTILWLRIPDPSQNYAEGQTQLQMSETKGNFSIPRFPRIIFINELYSMFTTIHMDSFMLTRRKLTLFRKKDCSLWKKNAPRILSYRKPQQKFSWLMFDIGDQAQKGRNHLWTIGLRY